PDPYRLIIDVHGKDVHGKQNRSTVLARTDTATMASQESDDDSSEPAASPSVDTKPDRLKERQVAGKGAVGSRKPGPVETDLPAENISADSKSDPAKPANGIGVIKTTVAVKGSDRRIPKTIVEADDSVPTTVSKLEHDKIRPDTMGEATDVSGADETKAVKADSRSSSISAASSSLSSSSPSPSSSPRRKKARSSTATSTAASTGTATASAPDTADLRSGDLHSGDLRSGDLHSESRDVTREARPTASGDRSLTRALGLKIGKIVIDAGHGGHDTGTIGPNGLLEKDVVLDVAKRLGRLLESRLGAEVIYTRQDDTFIPLETRTAIANRERADLFISIHANSSHDSDARGVETYYLNFTSSPEALEVAARENAVSEKSIHELQDLVKKIAMKDKIDESREFAGDVQESLYGGLALNSAGIRNRGIKKAPFIVLIGANMPSILAEISFVSNPTDERKMETSEHRQRIAESLYRGVSKYVNGLSGVKVASKIDKDQGQ
ncbi:MAG: N-acetylmuramoyl-L-alanine amidase, partial [Terriglobales bacterium]